MNYNDMTTEELLLLNSIDVSKFKKEISGDKLYDLRFQLDLYDTYRHNHFLVIGKHKIMFSNPTRELIIDKYSDYLKNEGYGLTVINDKFDKIKAKRKELRGITFNVLDADKIADVYNEGWDNFTGSLGGSCMRGKGTRYRNITTKLKYKEDMKIAVLRNSEGKLQARSLIWHNQYYDSIYANDNAYTELLKRKLEEDGFVYVSNNDVDVQLTESLYDEKVPYMDSVMYYDENTYTLNNTSYGDSYEFQDTDGYVWNKHRCESCGESIHRDDAYILHNGYYICDCCYSNGVIAYAEDEGDYYYTEDLVYLQDNEHYVTKNGYSYIYCVDRECYYSESYALFYAEDTGEYYSEDKILYYTEDTDNWYVDSDYLYYTVDSDLYYRYNDNLYYHKGEYYEDKPEGYED